MTKYKSKKCSICKQEFIPNSGMQKYCSNKCYKINRQNCAEDYREFNKEHIKKYWKKYRQLHKQELKKCHYNYIKNRLKIDLDFKLRTYLRNRIWWALKRNCKSFKTMELINCSINFLKQYLESQFKSGMSWSNYGKWHVDHIRPCASFDLTKVSEQKKCFHYTNLQPLWAEENLSKKDKVISMEIK
jgi:hypothetical protein